MPTFPALKFDRLLERSNNLLLHFLQRESNNAIQIRHHQLLQQRHAEQDRHIALERVEAFAVAVDLDGSIDDAREQERQGDCDGEQEPLFAGFGVRHGGGEDSGHGADGDEGEDEDPFAHFRFDRGGVCTYITIRLTGFDAANDDEDQPGEIDQTNDSDVVFGDGGPVGFVDVEEDAVKETKGRELQWGDGDVQQDEDATVEGYVVGLADGRELEAGLEEAREGEDGEEAPAGRATEAVAGDEKDGDCEGGEVDYQFADGDTVAVADVCHFGCGKPRFCLRKTGKMGENGRSGFLR